MIPYLLPGPARTIDFKTTAIDNQSSWRQINRRAIEGAASLARDGSIAIRMKDTVYRWHVFRDVPAEFELIQIRQDLHIYVDHNKQTVQPAPCRCSWSPPLPRDPDPGCRSAAVRHGARVFAAGGAAGGHATVRFRSEGDKEEIDIEMAPGFGCEVMFHWRGQSLLGIARYEHSYRLTGAKLGEPDPAVFQAPASRRFLPPR